MLDSVEKGEFSLFGLGNNYSSKEVGLSEKFQVGISGQIPLKKFGRVI